MKMWNKIGFGTYPLAGGNNGAISYGDVPKNVAIRSLRYAYDNGINFFDTSDFYGYGYVEELIGEALGNDIENVVVATKGGMISNDGKQNFSQNYLYQSLRGSLERLKVKSVDLYMLHSPSMEDIDKNYLIPFLNRLVNNGYIKEYGISLISPIDGFDAIEKYGFKTIEVNYNILDQRADKIGLFDLCKRKKIKTIIRTPLAQGILSGKFNFNDDKSDLRNLWKKEKIERLTEIYKQMIGSLNLNNYTDSQNCLRFCLSNDAVSVIIPGMKNIDEIFENISVLKQPKMTWYEKYIISHIYDEKKL